MIIFVFCLKNELWGSFMSCVVNDVKFGHFIGFSHELIQVDLS